MMADKPVSPPRKTQEADYIEGFKQTFSGVADHLKLDSSQRKFLESRWLDQVVWMESQANRFRSRHHKLQIVVVIGGVIIPALVSLTALGGCSSLLRIEDSNQSRELDACNAGFGVVTFAVSQAVAICAASEQLFKYGERWRHYRRNAELLKSHGWQFIELTGPYAPYAPHRDYQEAFRTFAGHVEEILQRDVELYINQIAEKQDQAQKSIEEKLKAYDRTSFELKTEPLPSHQPPTQPDETNIS